MYCCHCHCYDHACLPLQIVFFLRINLPERYFILHCCSLHLFTWANTIFNYLYTFLGCTISSLILNTEQTFFLSVQCATLCSLLINSPQIFSISFFWFFFLLFFSSSLISSLIKVYCWRIITAQTYRIGASHWLFRSSMFCNVYMQPYSQRVSGYL